MKRRRFFSLAAQLSAWVAGSRAWPARAAAAATKAAPQAPATDSAAAALQAVLDELIPAGGAMPSASAAGAHASLERRRSSDAEFGQRLDAALAALERLCRGSAGAPFTAAAREQRVDALRRLEFQGPRLFADLRDATYEVYYTNPAVQKAIGYDFRTGPEPTAPLAVFDESLVARVRRLAPFYRKAGP